MSSTLTHFVTVEHSACRPRLTRKSALLLCAGSRYGVTGRMLEWLFAVLWPNEHGKVRSMRAYGYHIEPFPLRSILWPN